MLPPVSYVCTVDIPLCVCVCMYVRFDCLRFFLACLFFSASTESKKIQTCCMQLWIFYFFISCSLQIGRIIGEEIENWWSWALLPRFKQRFWAKGNLLFGSIECKRISKWWIFNVIGLGRGAVTHKKSVLIWKYVIGTNREIGIGGRLIGSNWKIMFSVWLRPEYFKGSVIF